MSEGNKVEQQHLCEESLVLVGLEASACLNKTSKARGSGEEEDVKNYIQLRGPDRFFSSTIARNRVKDSRSPKCWKFKAVGVSNDCTVLTVVANRLESQPCRGASVDKIYDFDTLDIDVTVTVTGGSPRTGSAQLQVVLVELDAIGDFSGDT